MPLILCPNDNSHMQKVSREGVDIDICPECKGVWLDRGELDKLLNLERAEFESQAKAQQRFHQEVNDFRRDPEDWRKRHPYDEQRGRHRYDDDDDDDSHRGSRKRRRGFDLFDIFD